MSRNTTATPVQHYGSETANAVPLASDLLVREIATNAADQRIYTKDNSGVVIELAPAEVVVDNLTSTSSTSVLSAGQGKVLADRISGLGTIFEAPDIAGRDTLAAAGTATYLDIVHVLDNGDSRWARWQNLGTGASPIWVLISDEDGLSASLVATNLTYTQSATDGTVVNNAGTNAVIPLSTGAFAGLMSPAHHTKLESLSLDVGTF